MKHPPTLTSAQRTVRRISELRDLARRLARAGYDAGLHSHPPHKIAEQPGQYPAKRDR